MELFLFLLAAFIWWRTGSLIGRYFNAKTDDLVKRMHAYYFLGPRSHIVCIADGAIRGCLIGLAVVNGELFLAKAIVTQTCVVLAGVTTGTMRYWKELRRG